MTRNRKIALIMVSLIMSWLESFPYYGQIYHALIQRSALSLDTAQTVFICSYFIIVALLAFFIKEHHVKKWMYAGTAFSLLLSLIGWLWPVLQAFYIYHVLLGCTAALISIVFCYIFIYSFDSPSRLKATAAFEATTCFFALLINFVLIKINIHLAFASVCLILVALLWLTRRFDTSSMVSPKSIEKWQSPLKLILALGLAMFIIYLNSGLGYNLLDEAFQTFNADIPQFGITIMLLQIITYVVFFLTGSHIKHFILLYGTLLTLGLANLFGVLFPEYGFVFVCFSYISGCLSNLFLFSFMGDIALKYGRNFNTAGLALIAVGAGAVLGELFGKFAVGLVSDSEIPVYAIALFSIFISFLILPWLGKFVNDEMRGAIQVSQVSKDEETAGSEPQAESLAEDVDEAGPSDTPQDRLKYLCLKLPEGNGLTPREYEIAALILERYDNETIASRLFISKNTLKVHISRIYQKFQVSRKKELLKLIEDIEPFSKAQ